MSNTNNEKSSKSRMVVIVVLALVFIVVLLVLNSYEGKRDEGLSGTGDKYQVSDIPVGELITPAPTQNNSAPKLEYLGEEDENDSEDGDTYYNPYKYNCKGVITDASSMLEHVKLVCTIEKQQSRIDEMAVSEQFFDYVIQGNCALDMGTVYKYGVNDSEFFIITSDYMISGYLNQYGQICAMYYQELKK